MTLSSLKNHSALPILILLFLAFIWGSSFILIKKGLESFTPVQVGTIRVVFAFLFLLPFSFMFIKKYFKEYWKKILTYGILANLIPAILFSIAQTGLTSSLTGVLNSLTPIMTFLIGVILFKSIIKKAQVAGLIIGFAGTFALAFVNSAGELGSFNYFALFVIAATICYGISVNMVKTSFSNINSVALTSLAFLMTGPLALIILLSTDFFERLAVQPEAWASLGYIFLLGVAGTAFALIFFNKLVQLTTAVFASAVTYLIPIIAVMWGVIDGEPFFFYHFIGMALIIAGVYIVNRFR
jgi:drug/metabolite transporter (DMT)-like permease